jgi:hypothetical protein
VNSTPQTLSNKSFEFDQKLYYRILSETICLVKYPFCFKVPFRDLWDLSQCELELLSTPFGKFESRLLSCSIIITEILSFLTCYHHLFEILSKPLLSLIRNTTTCIGAKLGGNTNPDHQNESLPKLPSIC